AGELVVSQDEGTTALGQDVQRLPRVARHQDLEAGVLKPAPEGRLRGPRVVDQEDAGAGHLDAQSRFTKYSLTLAGMSASVAPTRIGPQISRIAWYPKAR